MSYLIIADSSCDISEQTAKEKKIKIAPLTLEVDGVRYLDDGAMNIAEYMEKVSKSKVMPKSSCPSPNDYMELMKGEGDDVYVVTLSSKLSGSYNSAVLAKDLYLDEVGEKNIHIFDSKSACAGEVLIALKIEEIAKQGLPFEKVVEQVEAYITGMQTIFVLDKIDNLQKTGRMSLVQATIANVLNIKLVLGSNDKGEIELFDRARGMKKTIDRMVKSISKYGDASPKRSIVVAHCLAEERAMQVKKMLEEAYNFKEVIVVATRGLSSNYANVGGVVLAY